MKDYEQFRPLLESLAQSHMVFIKGDANYRRLVGDYYWPYNSDFQSLAGYFPAPVVALRVLKSELCVGVALAVAEKAKAVDSKWMVDGKWGVIQLATP